MFKKILVALFINIAFIGVLSAKEPLNLSVAKQNVINYYASGQYNHDVTKKANKAQELLLEAIDKYKHQEQLAVKENSENKGKKEQTVTEPKKLAVVFDIDDTLVSTYSLNKENNFGGNRAVIDSILATVHKEPIAPMLKFYNFVKQNNVTIFLISGRQESLRENTIKLLNENGYTDWKNLFLQAVDGSVKNKISFKTNIRKFITNNGYDIVLNVGDQKSDLDGGYAQYAIKLPNPCYKA